MQWNPKWIKGLGSNKLCKSELCNITNSASINAFPLYSYQGIPHSSSAEVFVCTSYCYIWPMMHSWLLTGHHKPVFWSYNKNDIEKSTAFKIFMSPENTKAKNWAVLRKTSLFFCWWIVTFDLGSSENTSLPVFSILRVHWMNRWRRSTSYTKVLWVWRGRATALAVGLVHGHRKAQSERISVARDTKSWVSQQKNNLPFVRSSIVSQLPQNSRNPFIQDENICPNINVGRAPEHQLIPHSPIQPKSSKKRGEI